VRGQLSGVLPFDIRQPRVVGHALPFVGIVTVVVELLGAVRVADVPPTFRTDRVAPPMMSRDGRPGAWGVRILELRNDAGPSRGVKPQSSIRVGNRSSNSTGRISRLRVSTQASNLIVQVIERNEQDVRPPIRGTTWRDSHG
jgi:hypothetical protein